MLKHWIPAFVTRSLILIVAFVFTLGSCTRQPANPPNPILGGYVFSAYDSSEQLIFTGTISLRSLEHGYLLGQCTAVRKANAPEGIYDDDGGPCGGLLEGNKVELDFAPLLDDAGLLFEGEFSTGRFRGIWKLDGFATSPPLGKFEAVKTFHSF